MILCAALFLSLAAMTSSAEDFFSSTKVNSQWSRFRIDLSHVFIGEMDPQDKITEVLRSAQPRNVVLKSVVVGH